MLDLHGGQRTVGPTIVASPKGLLFDCDGTLIDTMPLFYHSWPPACAHFGLVLSEDDFYSFAGKPLPDIVRELFKRQKGADASEEMVAEFLRIKKQAHHATEAKLGHPKAIGCVVRIARAAVAAGIPVCVATSGLRDHVEAHIASAGLSDLFNAKLNNIVCAAEVKRGKPAPDIFIEAARRLGVDPRECRAYEDGESGLISAHGAGCHVIDVTFMDEYPMTDGLRRAKELAEVQRTWLPLRGGLAALGVTPRAATTVAGVAVVVLIALSVLRGRY